MCNNIKEDKNNPEYKLEVLRKKLIKHDQEVFDAVSNIIKKYRMSRYYKKILPGHLLIFFILIFLLDISDFWKMDKFDILLLFSLILLTSFTFVVDKRKYQVIWINFLLTKKFINVEELEMFKNPVNVIKQAYNYLETSNKTHDINIYPNNE